MYKELIFTSLNSLDENNNRIKILLDKHINVIIGPKGGGKSTLFDLLAGLKKNYISDNVIKALEEFGLKFEKAINFNNEIINYSQLTKIKTKDKIEDYKNRCDVIYQDDEIKKNLINFSEIEKNKLNYLKKQISISQTINNFINKLHKINQNMKLLYSLFKDESNNINWSNTFKMKDLDENDSFNLITRLDYKNFEIKANIQDEKRNIEELIQTNNQYINQLNKSLSLNYKKIFNDDEFIKNLNLKIEKIKKECFSFFEILNERKNNLIKIKKFVNSFNNAYKKTINEIKKENFHSDGLRSYEFQAINHFKLIAKLTYQFKKIFENLFEMSLNIDIENDYNQTSSLVYEIEQGIKLNEDDIFELLETVLYVPKNSKIDVSKWLNEMTKKGIKEFNEAKIINKFSEILKYNTKVLVDGGKNYETLSLGQKSIYGFKYKFNKSVNNDLFLDQPEDNLDNNTIANEILTMINSKKEQQVFIVTHNANIGILSNPNRLIIADLANKKHPYESIDVYEIMNNESANYLEGGKEYLKKRFQKIIEGEK